MRDHRAEHPVRVNVRLRAVQAGLPVGAVQRVPQAVGELDAPVPVRRHRDLEEQALAWLQIPVGVVDSRQVVVRPAHVRVPLVGELADSLGLRTGEDPDGLDQPGPEGLQFLGHPVGGHDRPAARRIIEALDPQHRRLRGSPVGEELPGEQVAGAGHDLQPVTRLLLRPEQDLEPASFIRLQVAGEQRPGLRGAVEELEAHERGVAERPADPVRDGIAQRRGPVHGVGIAGAVVEQVHRPRPGQHWPGGVGRPERALHAEVQQLQQAAEGAGPVRWLRGHGLLGEPARLGQPVQEAIPRAARQYPAAVRIGGGDIPRHAEERPVDPVFRHVDSFVRQVDINSIIV